VIIPLAAELAAVSWSQPLGINVWKPIAGHARRSRLKEESRKILERFIEKADYIESLSYLDEGEHILGMTAQKTDQGWEVTFAQPSDEQRDALLLTLRLFVQDKDQISIRRLSGLYSDPGISGVWKDEHREIRAKLNHRLQQTAAEGRKGKITYWDVFRIFLYGKIAHDNPDNESRKLFEKWVTDPMEFEILHSTFHEVVIWMVTAIINISWTSKEELARHSQ
jgi:hypothetical protein